MLKRLVNEARFTLTITTTGPVLVRSGHATLIGPDMAPVITYRNNDWQVYLPGSSLKGVLRSHLEKVGRTLKENVICNPFHKVPKADAFCGLKFQARKDRDEAINSVIAYKEACPICRLFGSTEFIGRVSINDAYLAEDLLVQPTEVRDGVGIDRLTGGAAYGAKFDLEAISSDVQFQTDIYLRNFETWQLGMLLLAVQDMEDGLIRIGSGRSRGLGSVKGAVDEVIINHLGRIEEKASTEVWGLGKFLSLLNGDDYGTQADDVITVSQAPEEDTRGIRHHSVYKDEALASLKEEAMAAFVTRIESWQMPDSMQRLQADN